MGGLPFFGTIWASDYRSIGVLPRPENCAATNSLISVGRFARQKKSRYHLT
jgi:hypothetical protein